VAARRAARVRGSGIGSIEATQAVIDLCDKHGIKPFIKVVPVENLNRVYEELEKCNESGARFVLDIAGSLNEDAFKRCAEAAPPNLGPPAPHRGQEGAERAAGQHGGARVLALPDGRPRHAPGLAARARGIARRRRLVCRSRC
jgi:hypothetical protein